MKKAKLAGVVLMGAGAATYLIPSLSPLPTILLVVGLITFIVGRSQD
jgi:uncharacterized membrane protein